MPGPSTHNLAALPDIFGLKKLCQSLAMLDAIVYPDWQGRYYSFNDHWNDEISLASMRDGSGDDFFILFFSTGAVIKGFAHESSMSPHCTNPPSLWLGVYEGVPKELKAALSEPAFSMEDATFCIWRSVADDVWRRGDIVFPAIKDADGSADLLALLDGSPQSYQKWAEEYYEKEVNLAAVERVYRHEPLMSSLVARLNPGVSLEDIEEDRKEIGYGDSKRGRN